MVLAAEIAKLFDVAPLVITRPEGIVRLALLLPSTTALQPTDARFSVTVHVLEEPPVRVVGLQSTELGATADTTVIVAIAELPPSVAVSVPVWSLETLVVLTPKVAEVAAAATVTDAGAVSAELVLDRVTLAPPPPAALVRVTVQVLDELDPRLAGLQASEDTKTGASRLIVALAELPLNAAVRVAV